jgi:hypothetical protein
MDVRMEPRMGVRMEPRMPPEQLLQLRLINHPLPLREDPLLFLDLAMLSSNF